MVKDTADLVPATTGIAKLPMPTQLLPASVDVIGAPLLEQQGARVLGDALKDASGFGVHTESGVADFFVVRGLDSETSALVMTDGAPEPVTTFYQLYNAERVEALKGPAGFLYGGNPLALRIVEETISVVFGGDTAAFLDSGRPGMRTYIQLYSKGRPAAATFFDAQSPAGARPSMPMWSALRPR